MQPRLLVVVGNFTSGSYSAIAFCLVCVFFGAVPAAAQTTDPSDAAALNMVFAAWGISAGSMGWNVSGEVCSGTATDSTIFDNNAYNPFIKCDCHFDNGTTCRIAQLKVYALDVVGPIPDALWNLTYLSNLMISQNYLTGPLSHSIGNLTRMQYLSLGINALSGQLPKELGLLTDLRSLAFGTNNFSGPLPSELGNLVKLEEIYFDSAGVSGEIPQTFRNLRSLVTMWASDNELNETIPEFIGNLTKLTALRLQGNNFHGSIPSTFSNLTAMQDLRISDIANGTSSLAFLGNMKSLGTLVLRNNNISGTIPSSIGDLQSLSLLDLSFNNLSSTIPASLFNMSSLSYLFLGSNRLTGSLPEHKASSLANIDLSYNFLSGRFPRWVSIPNWQLNLVANNFKIGSSNSSVLPAGLECLQRNFPCNQGSGIYSDFAIKCGGRRIRSSSNTVFESDSEPLGPATYYMTGTERWAVSNVGLFAENIDVFSTISRSSQFANTLDSELFQTARVSPGSLRYYGLGLKNGNYTLSLQFAESLMVDGSSSWKGLGRRRFDVYIQGSLVLKNFDILSAAGGVAYSAVKRDFTASVTENYIEVHLFWAGKGTCCVPVQGTYGPLISAISATPNFVPTVANKAPSSETSNTGMIMGTVVGVASLLIILTLVIFYCIRRNSDDNDEEELQLLSLTARPNTFTYSELRTATGDFSPANKLGQGGFGPVYKGKLSDGRVIAVKQLAVGSHQGKTQFYTEIATISAVQHRNLVKLLGCCVDGVRRMLVYEYLENNSLDHAIFGDKSLDLNWKNRFNICLGIARGLTYLHEESRIRIIHRDMKASNILLDAELNPKISDFGLAKLYDDKMTHISTGVAGTVGYLAPEYAMRGHLTEKADIFGFGVVALEIVSGRPNTAPHLENEKVYLMEWAWQMHDSGRDLDLIDPRLTDFNPEEVKRIIGVALLCTQTQPSARPAMSRVVSMLLGSVEVPPVISKPMYLTDWNFDDHHSQAYNSLGRRGIDLLAACPSQREEVLSQGR